MVTRSSSAEITCCARHPGLAARLLQRGVGLTLKRALHTADVGVALVRELVSALDALGELLECEGQQRQRVAAAGIGRPDG